MSKPGLQRLGLDLSRGSKEPCSNNGATLSLPRCFVLWRFHLAACTLNSLPGSLQLSSVEYLSCGHCDCKSFLIVITS